MNAKDILESYSFHEKCHRLYDIIYKNRDIGAIIDEASLVFGNSIILSDNSYSVIACTSFVDSYNPNPDDALWSFISDNGYYPPEYIDYLINSGTSGRFITAYPGITKDKGFRFRYYSRRIYVGEKNIGFVTLVEHKNTLSEEDTYLLNEFTHVLKVALERIGLIAGSSNERYSYVISELLNSRPDSGRLKNRLAYSGLSFLPYLNIVIIKKLSLNRDLAIEYLLKITGRFIANGKGVVYNKDSVAYIAMRENLEDDCLINRKELLSFLKKRNLVLGISYTYTDVGNSFLHVYEAISSIDVGRQYNPTSLIYDYEEYCIYSTVSRNVSSEECLSLINPRIGMIREYDRIHNTDYYETLKTYIESDLNMTHTAKKMNIHRNTVDYRINKVRDCFGIEPDKGSLVMGYRLSFFLFDSLK